MGFRFRRSIRLAGGLRLNLSKGRPSLSVGGHGFTENISTRGVRSTASLPGTGLSYSTNTAAPGRRTGGKGSLIGAVLWFALMLAVGLWLVR